jgi:L-fucose isomerase-like protein
MRIGLIGYIPEIMLSLNFDIFAVKKVFGPTVVPVDFYKLNDYVERARKNLGSKIDSKIDYIKKNVGKVMVSDETVSESLSFYYAFLELAKDLNLDSIAINCFPTPAIKGKTCLAVSNLNDEGIVAACEGDVNSAIIMSAFNLITGKASLNSDLIIEYENENQIMFSHCGGGPFNCASKMSDIILDEQSEVKSGLGVYYPVKTGGKEVTIINLVGNELTYRMCILNGTSVALDKLTYYGNPINVKFKTDVEDLINTIGNEGFGHHWMVSFGDHKDIFIEICKMLKIYCINID